MNRFPDLMLRLIQTMIEDWLYSYCFALVLQRQVILYSFSTKQQFSRCFLSFMIFFLKSFQHLKILRTKRNFFALFDYTWNLSKIELARVKVTSLQREIHQALKTNVQSFDQHDKRYLILKCNKTRHSFEAILIDLFSQTLKSPIDCSVNSHGRYFDALPLQLVRLLGSE